MIKIGKSMVLCLLIAAIFLMPISAMKSETMTSKNDVVTSGLKVNTINLQRSDLPHTESNSEPKLMIAGDGLRCLRFYWVHVPPSYDGSEPVPLVLAFHGSASMGTTFNPFMIIWHYRDTFFEDYTKLSEKADEEGFIVVYPKALVSYAFMGNFYAFAFIPPNYPDSWFKNSHFVDDIGFTDDLIDKMQNEYNINPDRIYMTGLSNGADTIYCLGGARSDKIAAIAPVAGETAKKEGDAEEYTYPDPEGPVSVIIFHGTKDHAYPWDGDQWGCGVPSSVQFWVEHNGCDSEPEIYESDSGNIVRYTYSNGTDGTEVILYKIIGGTHCWPGNDFTDPNNVAPWLVDTIQEIDATDLMWDFFEAHPKQ